MFLIGCAPVALVRLLDYPVILASRNAAFTLLYVIVEALLLLRPMPAHLSPIYNTKFDTGTYRGARKNQKRVLALDWML